MAMMQLVDAQNYVGQEVTFAAVIQQITIGKRIVINDQNRIAQYHVLLLADASLSFFKLTCWGDAIPTLSSADHAPHEVALCVGDMVLLSHCMIKQYKGNVEAQFKQRRSRVQLLYRRDRYFNTRDVRLKDLYPMIEWYKSHKHELGVVVAADSDDPIDQTITRLHDVRDNMVVNVVCHVRPCTSELAIHKPSTTALCRQVVMVDSKNDVMQLFLWDQHADVKSYERLVANDRDVFHISGLVIGAGASTSHIANTTPSTSFQLLPPTHPWAQALHHRMQPASTVDPSPICRFASIQQLLEAPKQDTVVTIANLRIERLVFSHLTDSQRSNRLLPSDTLALVECCCQICGKALRPMESQARPPLYSRCTLPSCRKAAETSSLSDRIWRYRAFDMVVIDAQESQLTLQVPNEACEAIVGRIPASMVVFPHAKEGNLLSIDVRWSIIHLLNALVDPSARFQLEIQRQSADSYALVALSGMASEE